MKRVIMFVVILFLILVHGIMVKADGEMEKHWRENHARSSGPELLHPQGW